MDKIVVALLVGIAFFIVLFIGLVVGVVVILDNGSPQVTPTDHSTQVILSDKDAAKTVSDVSTDLSGIRSSLNAIDQKIATGK